jgi:pilus assembly protein CpaC
MNAFAKLRRALAVPMSALLVYASLPMTVAERAVAAAAAADQSRVIHLAAQSSGNPAHMTLSLNKAAIIELDTDARDVLVSNPDIVDAVVRSPRRIFILSLKVGQTNAFFLDAQGKQIAELEIRVEPDVTDLGDALLRHIPDSQVKVESLNDNVVLDGTVKSAQDASTAQDLAARFAGSPSKVVNMLKVNSRQQVLIEVRVSEMSRSIAKQFGVNVEAAIPGAGGVPIMVGTDNQFSLLGRALSDVSGTQVGEVCKTTNYQNPILQNLVPSVPGGNPPSPLTPANATNLVKTNGGESANALGIVPGAVNLVGQSFGFSSTNLCNASPNNAQGIMKALEQVGLVRTLAEPNLTAVSGESAKFLAGGEFPVPSSRDQYGNVVVQFKQFGVGLAFTPVVLSDNHISLQLSTEVSELTNEGAFVQSGGTTTDANGNTITTAGLTVPALAVRRTETTVELPSGGSLMIGGLIQQQTKQNIDAFPGLKELPVLGALFRSRDFQQNETELVVMVTAYLVDPVKPTQIAMPDQGFAPASDIQTILNGRLNAVYGKGEDVLPAQAKGATGYIIQ